MAAVKVENLRLLRQQIEKERLDEQLDVAANIQRRLLPQADPEIEGYEVRGLTRSCYEIGGDYFDFTARARWLALVVADVSGKGVGAALLMAAFQSSVRTLRRDWTPRPHRRPAQRGAARELGAGEVRDRLLGELDLDSHTLTYVNAGHNPPLVLDADGLRLLGHWPGHRLDAQALLPRGRPNCSGPGTCW